jgi:formylglycine-generating enzyme required for sulfatase activity
MPQRSSHLLAWFFASLAPVPLLAIAQPEKPPASEDETSDLGERCITVTVGESKLAIPFARIEPGTFAMGYRPNSPFRYKPLLQRGFDALLWEGTITNEGPVRETTITKPFYLARYKTTVQEYCAFLNDIPEPERFIVFNRFNRVVLTHDRYEPHPGAERMPIDTVPWEGAVAYCEWLSDQSGRTIRLPTEAEWEYAARGTEGRYYPWGDDRDNNTVYWYYSSSKDDREWAHADPVGSHPANATPDGLFDMIGPTREWVADWYAEEYNPDDNMDPTGPDSGYYRDMRERCGIDDQYRVLRADDIHASSRTLGGLGVEGANAGIYGFRILMEEPVAAPDSDASPD